MIGMGTTSRLHWKFTLLVGLLMSFMLWTPSVEAAPEARCVALGASCVSAETLNHTSMVDDGSGFYHLLPQDTSDTKRFDGFFSGPYVMHWGCFTGLVPSGFTGLNALRLTPGYCVIENSGSRNNSMLNQRVAVRYYFRNSVNYQSTQSGTDPSLCTNDKYSQMGDYVTSWTDANGGWSSSAAGSGGTGQGAMDYPNHWVRLEYIMEPFQQSPASQYTVYIKDITAGTPELSFRFTGGAHQSSEWSLIQPLHRYRAGTCAGYTDVMFVMMAAFPTGSGMRIGGASELESGAPPDTTPPPAPTGLQIQ